MKVECEFINVGDCNQKRESRIREDKSEIYALQMSSMTAVLATANEFSIQSSMAKYKKYVSLMGSIAGKCTRLRETSPDHSDLLD